MRKRTRGARERLDLVGDVIGRDALAARDVDVHDDAASEVEIETAHGDVGAVGKVVARRIGVRADVQRDANVAQRQIRAGVHVGVDRAHERRIARPDVDRGVDERRDIDQRHPAAAMIFSSTAIGVGSESTPTVVRVGWMFAEQLGVDAVEAIEVALHVGQIDSHVEDFLQRAAGLFENRLDVVDRGARLRLDAEPGSRSSPDGAGRCRRETADRRRAARADTVRPAAARVRCHDRRAILGHRPATSSRWRVRHPVRLEHVVRLEARAADFDRPFVELLLEIELPCSDSASARRCALPVPQTGW